MTSRQVDKYVFKRDLNDESDGAHLTSFGIEFQTEEEAKENERSPSVALLCAGLLRRGMVYELERVLRVCNGFLCSMSVTYTNNIIHEINKLCVNKPRQNMKIKSNCRNHWQRRSIIQTNSIR